MPYADPAKRTAHQAERWRRDKADPVRLEKRRKSARECQRRHLTDSEARAVALQRTAEWRKKNLDYRAAWSLKKKYGMTLEAYWAMFDAQGGVCAICERPEIAFDQRTSKPRRLAVDHCHETGKVRQLLCFRCNGGIGKFNDDPRLLKAAIGYLERHAAR